MVTQVRLLSISRSSEVCLLEWVWPWLANVREGLAEAGFWINGTGLRLFLWLLVAFATAKIKLFLSLQEPLFPFFPSGSYPGKAAGETFKDCTDLYHCPFSLKVSFLLWRLLSFHVCWHDFFWVCFSFASFWGFCLWIICRTICQDSGCTKPFKTLENTVTTVS